MICCLGLFRQSRRNKDNPMELKIPKKLIEVALPLDDINNACAHEKMPGIGAHPRGIHLWWARRPLAAARAIIFAQMVVQFLNDQIDILTLKNYQDL